MFHNRWLTVLQITELLLELSDNEWEGTELSDMHDKSVDDSFILVVSAGSESDEHIEIEDSENQIEFVARESS